MIHLHAYVHDDTAERLRAHAHANDRSLAGELRRALRLYVEGLDVRPIQAAAVAADEGGGGAVLSPPCGRPASHDGKDRA